MTTRHPSPGRSRTRQVGGKAPLVAAILTFSVVMSMAPVGAGAQEPGQQEPATTVVLDTTVPEDGGVATTLPVEPEGDGVQTVTTEAESGVETETVAEENRRLLLIVAGLVAVAVALALMTIRYWRVTRPVSSSAERYDDHDTEDDRYEDPAPESTDEIFVARTDDGAAGAGSSARQGRRSRRAIAGADHGSADEGWEPMSTGEQESVAAPESLSRSRPGRIDRRRVLGSSED